MENLVKKAEKFILIYFFCSKDEVDALMDFAPVDVSGFLDYKALCYIITHGQEEE